MYKPPLQRKTTFQGHRAGIYALAPTADKKEIISAAGDGWIARWNLEDAGDGMLVARVDAQLFSVVSLPDQDALVAGDMNGGVHWIWPDQPALGKDLAHHQKGVFDLKCFEGQLYSLGGSGMLSRWNLESARPTESVSLSGKSLRSIAYSPIRRELAIGASDHNIYFLDLDSLEVKYMIGSAHGNSVFSVCYSKDGQILYSGGRDAHLKAWDLSNAYQLVSDQPAHWFTINDVRLNPSGEYLATASRDKTIRIWDAQNLQLLQSLNAMQNHGHINSVNALLWTEHGLISASDDRSMILWKHSG